MKALKRRVVALESAGRDTFIPVDMSFLDDLNARLDAWRDGRPYSDLPRPPAPAVSTNQADPNSPGARFAERLEQLRQTLVDDEAGDVLAQQQRETVRAIQQGQRDAERRIRQRARRARSAQRQ